MLKLFDASPSVVTNSWTQAIGSFVGITPIVMALMFPGTTNIQGTGGWANGTLVRLGTIGGTLRVGTGEYEGIWYSNTYDTKFTSLFTNIELDIDISG